MRRCKIGVCMRYVPSTHSCDSRQILECSECIWPKHDEWGQKPTQRRECKIRPMHVLSYLKHTCTCDILTSLLDIYIYILINISKTWWNLKKIHVYISSRWLSLAKSHQIFCLFMRHELSRIHELRLFGVSKYVCTFSFFRNIITDFYFYFDKKNIITDLQIKFE